MTPAVRAVAVTDIPVRSDDEHGAWRPVRHHLGIRSFGANASTAHVAGAVVIGEHTEHDDSGTDHEELFVVLHGHARFTVDGQEVDAPAGTLVLVADPRVRRGAVALVAGTTVLTVGASPGRAFEVSAWERRALEATG